MCRVYRRKMVQRGAWMRVCGRACLINPRFRCPAHTDTLLSSFQLRPPHRPGRRSVTLTADAHAARGCGVRAGARSGLRRPRIREYAENRATCCVGTLTYTGGARCRSGHAGARRAWRPRAVEKEAKKKAACTPDPRDTTRTSHSRLQRTHSRTRHARKDSHTRSNHFAQTKRSRHLLVRVHETLTAAHRACTH